MTTVSGAVLKTSEESRAVNVASDLVSQTSKSLAEDVETFLKGVTQDVKNRRKASRMASSEPVTVTFSDGRQSDTQLIDISTQGAQILGILGTERMARGEPLTLSFRDGIDLSCSVVRHTDRGYGVGFTDLLPQDHPLLTG